MNIIFNDSNNSIGGIEVMFIELAKYYLSESHRVIFLVKNRVNIYTQYFSHDGQVDFVETKLTKSVRLYSEACLRRESERVTSILQDSQYVVFSPYFEGIQLSMALFGSCQRFKLVHLWSHPQNWARNNWVHDFLSRIGTEDARFVWLRAKNRIYRYQRELIIALAKANSDFYASRSTVIFNNWYYRLSLDPERVPSFPIAPLEQPRRVTSRPKCPKHISLLWVGRLVDFKIAAICDVAQAIEELAQENSRVSFSLDIVGDRRIAVEKLVTARLRGAATIRFLGAVTPESLAELMSRYDIGVGMGLTVRKMAQAGLPAIVVDARPPRSRHALNANWIHETNEGDAGDGFYLRLARSRLAGRRPIRSLLEDVIQNPDSLQELSHKGVQFVDRYHNIQQQAEIMLRLGLESKFNAAGFPIYRSIFFEGLLLPTTKRLYRLLFGK